MGNMYRALSLVEQIKLQDRVVELEQELARLEGRATNPVAWYDPREGLPYGWTEKPPIPGAVHLFEAPPTEEPTELMVKIGAEMFEACLHSAASFEHHAYHVYMAMCNARIGVKKDDYEQLEKTA